jgi:hypothetical protein
MGAGADYGTMMAKLGYPYYAIGTRIQFDPKESYPKFLFSAIRPLNDEEAMMVKELQTDVRTARVLADDQVTPPAQVAAPTVQSAFEQPPVNALPAPAPALKPEAPTQDAPKPAKPKLEVVKVAPAVVPDDAELDTGEASQFEADLDAQLDALLPK